MIVLALFVIAVFSAVGMSHIIVDGNIFSKLRGYFFDKYKTQPNHWVIGLITCYQCTGFWSGVFMGVLLQPFQWYSLLSSVFWNWFAIIICVPLYLIVTPFIVGCASSYFSMAGAALLNYLDAPAMAAASKRTNESNKT